jgi:magnesium-transporting ATPase (P-type)
METIKEILDWTLLALYTVVTFSFIPLFMTIMNLLKLVTPDLYKQIKTRLITNFTFFILFLISRLYLYVDLKFLRIYFNKITVYSTIPFYLTELIITGSLSFVLYISSQMERESAHLSSSQSKRDDFEHQVYP